MGLIIIIFLILVAIFVPHTIKYVERKEFEKMCDNMLELIECIEKHKEENEKQFLEQIRKNTLKNNK